MPPAATWDLDGPLGRETWVGRPGAFDQVLLDGEPVSLDPRDGALHLLRARASSCAHPGPFPFAFQFCPECGARLQAAPEWDATTWSTPGGTATGLPHPAAHGVPDPASRVDMPVPQPAQLDLFIAGTPARLLAFDQTSGRLHGWTEAAGAWHDVAQLRAALNLPRWSMAIAAFTQGAALPGDAGPAFVALPPRGAAVFLPDAVLGISRCLGGAAGLGSTALLPVMTADGLALAVTDAADPGWSSHPVPDAPAAELFAAPSVTATEAFWAGQHGQLFARLHEGALHAEYRPWRDGWSPMQAVRPVLSPNGVLHQLGRLDGRQSFEALLPPGATPQRREFDRYVTSIGAVSFMGAARFREPWEARGTEYRIDPNAFLLPLLGFADGGVVAATCSPRAALRSFTETQPDAEDALECRIVFAASSIVPTDLRMTVRARSAMEITALVHGRTLLVYDARANRCSRWALRDA